MMHKKQAIVKFNKFPRLDFHIGSMSRPADAHEGWYENTELSKKIKKKILTKQASSKLAWAASLWVLLRISKETQTSV